MSYISYIRHGPSAFLPPPVKAEQKSQGRETTVDPFGGVDTRELFKEDHPALKQLDPKFWKDKKVKSLALGGIGAALVAASGVGAAVVVTGALTGIATVSGVLPLVIGIAIVATLVALAALGLITASLGAVRAFQAHQQVKAIVQPFIDERMVEIDNYSQAVKLATQTEKYLEPIEQTKEFLIKKIHYNLILQFTKEKIDQIDQNPQITAIENFDKENRKNKDPEQAEKNLNEFLTGTDIPNIWNHKDLYKRNTFNTNVKTTYDQNIETINYLCKLIEQSVTQTINTEKNILELDIAAQQNKIKKDPYSKIIPVNIDIDTFLIVLVDQFNPHLTKSKKIISSVAAEFKTTLRRFYNIVLLAQ